MKSNKEKLRKRKDKRPLKKEGTESPRKEKRRSSENSRESKGPKRENRERPKTGESLKKMQDKTKLMLLPRFKMILEATMSEPTQCAIRSNNAMSF